MERDKKLLSANDVVALLKEFVGEYENSGKQGSLFSFVSKLTGISVAALTEEIEKNEPIDGGQVVFRGFDDTALPLEFFFDYNVPRYEQDDFVSGLGFRKDICEKVSFCLSYASLDDVLFHAILTFDDGDERWVELGFPRGTVEALIGVMEQDRSGRGLEALRAFDRFIDDNLGEFCGWSDRSINREKLGWYLDDEMILEFSSPEECMEYFNTYDFQNFKSVDEMKRYQGMLGFGLDGKWYHISYREALSVWEPSEFCRQAARRNTEKSLL